MLNNDKKFIWHITYAMVLGIIFGSLLQFISSDNVIRIFIVEDLLALFGEIFIKLLRMLVVPIVFISLVNGVINLDNVKKLNKIGLLGFFFYLITTAIAIIIALYIASLVEVGKGVGLVSNVLFKIPEAPSMHAVLLDLFPDNPFQALANGNMLQVIFLALVVGYAVLTTKQSSTRIVEIFSELNIVVMKIVYLVMRLSPLGVFCLLSSLVARSGFSLIIELVGYMLTVMCVLFLHMLITYGLLIRCFTVIGFNNFLAKMWPAMCFAFSVASSSASIPIVMETAEEKLQLNRSVVSFIIPLGSTINMDGTAIMQGVATVFIANVYGISIGLHGYITVVLMATVASIGTAGVPGMGIVTLSMVLSQVGLPVEGVAMILGVDRILDMLRTAVNITGDCAVASVIDSMIYRDQANN